MRELQEKKRTDKDREFMLQQEFLVLGQCKAPYI